MARKKKAIIYKLAGRFPVVIRGRLVAAGRTAFQAAEMAKQHGATAQEVKEWTEDLRISTSLSQSGSPGTSTREKKVASKAGLTSRSGSASQLFGQSHSSSRSGMS